MKKIDTRVIKAAAFVWVSLACVGAWIVATTLPAVPEIYPDFFSPPATPSIVAVLTISMIWIGGVIATLRTWGKEPILYSSLATLFLIVNHCLVSMWPNLAGWTFWMLLVVSVVTYLGAYDTLN